MERGVSEGFHCYVLQLASLGDLPLYQDANWICHKLLSHLEDFMGQSSTNEDHLAMGWGVTWHGNNPVTTLRVD